MDIDIEVSGAAIQISPHGNIDQTTAKAFEEAVVPRASECKEGGPALLISMADVGFISSVGLRVFMIVSKTTRPHKGRIIVTNMNDVVREVFQISRFDKIVEVMDTTEDALAAL